MYTAEFADIYEPLYRHRGKDWDAEAEMVVKLIRDRSPGADSLLDVACGTGTHLAAFAQAFGHVEGVELAEPMRAVALRRLPDVAVHAGDMRDFRLGRTFDAVTCLFNSIAYVADVGEMRAAACAMAGHLKPGGVLVVEPWWFPDRFIEHHLAADAGTIDGRAIARVSRSSRDGRRSRLEAHFLVAESACVKAFTLVHDLMLFSEKEYRDAFVDAGCTVEFQHGGLTGRGLFIAVRH
jgi:dTDP-3-amino-3,4,6-trideoxy-alpha-D-glucopyranose N,N-dimethyltransferase/N-dimethyltransferase